MAKFKTLLDVVAKAIAPDSSSAKQHATTSSSSSSGGGSSKGESRGQQLQEGAAGGAVTQLTFPSLQVHLTCTVFTHNL
jgi:hypothetical protein